MWVEWLNSIIFDELKDECQSRAKTNRSVSLFTSTIKRMIFKNENKLFR